MSVTSFCFWKAGNPIEIDSVGQGGDVLLECFVMARASQYSRGRRLMLQGTLVLVLGATLGLAAMLGQSRDRAMAIELSSKPHWAGKLAIRLPKGWALLQDTDEIPITVVAKESKGATPGELRSIEIHQSSSSSATPQEILSRHLSRLEGELGRVRSFNLLGQPAFLARFSVYEPIPMDPFGRAVEVPAWFAGGVVPGAGLRGQDLAVVIGVRGQGMAGPAGMRVIDQLAKAMTLRPGVATTVPSE
jgi:hypothetical protein